MVTPAAATLVMVMAPDSYFHVMLREPWALIFIFVLLLAEKAGEELRVSEKKNNMIAGSALNWAVLLFSAVMIFQFAVMQGVVAFNMNERYEKSYALCVRIADRLEQIPEYETGDKVAIIGGLPDENNYPVTSITGADVGWYFGVNGDYCVASTRDFATFFSRYLGVTINPAEDEEISDLSQTPEFDEMKTFPDQDSFRRINDIWVIKLNG